MSATVLSKRRNLQYKTQFQGLDVSIESPKGHYRRWTDKHGRQGVTRMAYPYGYLRDMTRNGADGESIDVYLGPDDTSDYAFIVHQLDPKTGDYDEDKVFLGFRSDVEAKRAYLMHRDGMCAFSGVTTMTMGQFRHWLNGGSKMMTTGQFRRWINGGSTTKATVLTRSRRHSFYNATGRYAGHTEGEGDVAALYGPQGRFEGEMTDEDEDNDYDAVAPSRVTSPRVGRTLSSPFVGHDRNPGRTAFVAGGGDRDTATPNVVDYGPHVPYTRTWGPGTKRMPRRATRNERIETGD